MLKDEAPDGQVQDERRRVERVTTELQVDFRAEEMKEMFIYSYVTDISGLGIFLRHNAPFAVGTRLTVRFSTPEGQLEVKGEVRWISPFQLGPLVTREPGMGVKFVDPPEGLKQRLQQLVGGALELRED
jgi:uncharacterized protein (TIGR02266 family)